MSVHKGRCLCGNATFTIEGDFETFFLCHCGHCRKDTGSAHAANLFSSTASLAWTSGEDKVRSFTLAGTRHTKAFCTECGSALPNLQMDGKLLVVPAGSLDTPVTLKPAGHIFTASRAGWDDGLETVPKFEALPS
ncbi:GFA family protein [Roseibium aggregatum]|uniref:GFA family protein n=1 Tax=Roseibium aggregatum TaxID=187304 RepID=UPI001A901714|nr:GFA family protein [Roseibium aggregatum]MBN8180184.1 GFA family protein [Roseibium aggregatum]UES45668.1 aldehyde-activating protein [Roseibium aggregatum]